MTTTVGSLANVPNPGSPVASPWAQAVTALGVHPFATVAAIKAGWTTAPNGAKAIALDTGITYTRLGGVWCGREPRFFRHAGALNAAGQNFDLPIGVTYLAAPVVNLTAEVGANLDLLAYVSSISTTTIGVRIVQNTNTVVNASYGLHVVTFGTYTA